MTWLGLALQIVGTLLVGYALLQEWLSKSVAPSQLGQTPSKRRNPWEQRLRSSFRRPYGLTLRPASSHTGHRLAAVAEYLVARIDERENMLAKDWKVQAAEDAQVRAELVHLFNEQSRLLAEQHDRMRGRVTWEMFGLLIALVGTVVSTAATS